MHVYMFLLNLCRLTIKSCYKSPVKWHPVLASVCIDIDSVYRCEVCMYWTGCPFLSVSFRSELLTFFIASIFQAYLSLPEGTASVVGLIAMMTDHYHVLVRLDICFSLTVWMLQYGSCLWSIFAFDICFSLIQLLKRELFFGCLRRGWTYLRKIISA